MYHKRRIYYEFYGTSDNTGQPCVGFNIRMGQQCHSGILSLVVPASVEYFLDRYTGVYSFFSSFAYMSGFKSIVVRLYSDYNCTHSVVEGTIPFDTAEEAGKFYQDVVGL